ncbi:hypothetical protein AB0D59_04865 [Streptomyces sp. NPDC048417]|uniref:hypothetical protein n=1 Tax=Streptomyces sp. NPDC048417 TaxID=3155387 RepID=UPI003415415F
MGGQGNVAATRLWNGHATPPTAARSRAGIAGFLDGIDPPAPGPVSVLAVARRAGADSPAPVPQFGTVAVKP